MRAAAGQAGPVRAAEGKPTTNPTRMYALIVEAGEAGILADEMMSRLNLSKEAAKKITLVRKDGFQYYTLLRGNESARYFAREEWRDAAQVVHDAAIKAAEREWRIKHKAANPLTYRKQELTPEAKARKNAARRIARAKEAALRPKKKSGPKAKLHSPGKHIKAKAADGRIVTRHQGTASRGQTVTVKLSGARGPALRPGEPDLSHAKFTICPTRWT